MDKNKKIRKRPGTKGIRYWHIKKDISHIDEKIRMVDKYALVKTLLNGLFQNQK